ncbi:hypothetical protein JB92DRAFT_3112625 [Gautieria morchelliformis]|nr:hypothetical protein JB92DRAFT_3112625 [Gautieria morchelliformis]
MDSLRDSFTLDIDQFSQFTSQSQQSSTIPALAPWGESGYSYHDTTSHHLQPGTSQHNIVMSYPSMNNVAKASVHPSHFVKATSHPQPVIGAVKPLIVSKPQSHQMKSLDISVNSPNSPDMPNELEYPHTAYWTRKEWDSFRDDQKISGLHTTNSRRIRLKDLSLPNPSLAYITNEVGTGVNGYQAKDM